MDSATQEVGGPFFDDLQVGQIVEDAPSLTLTDGLAAQHRAIVGDRLRLAAGYRVEPARARRPRWLIRRWSGTWRIGQSTLLTQRVIANLFYRGFMFRRFPQIGDTLYTTTEVVACGRIDRARAAPPPASPRCACARPIRRAGRCWTTGAARCCRCAIPTASAEHDADLEKIPCGYCSRRAARADRGLEPRSVSRGREDSISPILPRAMTWKVTGGDVVSSAPELARLTLNIAMAHHDAA